LSLKRISQYRTLLKPTEDEDLNDNIWIEADTNGWTEHFIRETYLPSLKPQAESSTAVEHQDGERLTAVNHQPHVFSINDRVDVWTDLGWLPGTIRYIKEEQEKPFGVYLENSGSTHYYGADRLKPIAPDNPSSAAQTAGETPYSEKYKQLLPPHDNPATRYVNPNRDGFGKEFAPPKPSPFGSAHVVGNDGEIGAPPMNLKGKKVRLKDGREGTIWEDKGGDKLMFLKTGATISNEVYRSAIASVMTGGLEEVNGWRVGDKVVYLRDGEKLRGTVLEVHPRIMHVLEANGETANVLYENAARVSDKMPAPNWPPSDSPKQRNNPNDKFIQDGRIKTMVAQARYLAASLECKEAEDSLALLSGLTLGDIQKVSKENHPDSVQDMLGGHYEHIANGMQKFMSEIEDILRNWALLDEAERRGE
jgi:hypothetical protein